MELDGGNPGGNTYFPIWEAKSRFWRFGSISLERARPAIKDYVRDLTPWRGGDDNLWMLHELDIHDKHRLLVPVGAAQTGVVMGIVATPPWADGESVETALEINAKKIVYPLYDGAEFLRVQPAARLNEFPFFSIDYQPLSLGRLWQRQRPP